MVRRLAPGLTLTQSHFLHDHLPKAISLDEAVALAKVHPMTLRRWLAQPAFNRQLRQTMHVIARRRDATIALAAARAAERLAASLEADHPLSVAQHRACVELLKLARAPRSVRAASSSPHLPGTAAEQQHLLDQLVGREDK